MTKTDDRIDDLKQVVSGIDNRLCEVEKTISKTREEALLCNLEQYKMITKAVTEGIKPIIEKIESQEKRIVALEKQDGKKAIFFLKTVIVTSITLMVGNIISGYLNNYASITSQIIRDNTKTEEVVTSENNNNK